MCANSVIIATQVLQVSKICTIHKNLTSFRHKLPKLTRIYNASGAFLRSGCADQ